MHSHTCSHACTHTRTHARTHPPTHPHTHTHTQRYIRAMGLKKRFLKGEVFKEDLKELREKTKNNNNKHINVGFDLRDCERDNIAL